MKKALIVIIVLAIAGAGYFFYTKSKGGTEGTGITSGVKSLKELITANTPQKCTFSATDESGKTEGTTYVAGGKVRSDASVTASGKTTLTHMISDGKTNYIWTEGEKTGFKMTVTEGDKESSEAPKTENESVSSEGDLNQKTDYSCSGWIPDSSLFNPPTNVTFSDFSQLIPSAAPAGGTSGSSSQCSYCNNLTGEDKTSCLSAFKCN